MNALKFLAVDRSLCTGRNVVGRFQMRQDSLLPHFNAAEAEAGTELVEPRTESQPSRWRRVIEWLTGRKANVVATPVKPASVPAHGESVAAVSTTAKRESSCERLTSPASSNQTLPVVQSEFRFENVKVVCNDLHDADFEIVSVPAAKQVFAGSTRELATA